MKEENKIDKLSDKSFRTQLRKDPKKHIAELFSNNDTQDVEIVVKTNTKNTVYVVFPSSIMDMAMLDTVSAAAYHSYGTVGTLITSLSTAGCAAISSCTKVVVTNNLGR